MKKIIVSDYDKTFYLNDKDIELNKEMVNKFLELNNIFSIATGRSYFSLKKELDKFHFIYDYLIVNHGATILTKDNKVIANYTIDNDIINEIISDLDLSDSIKYIYYTLESEDMILKNNLNKINVQYKNKDKAMEIRDLINKKYSSYVKCYFVNINSVEIISNKTNKAKAIELLIDKLNIDKKNVYTIGDGENDIEMIKEFNGYCMKSSVDKLKKVSFGEYSSVSELIKDVIDKNL